MPEVHHETAYFTGRVQGVGFRYAALQVAREFEVSGFVANLPDGRVHLEAEGAPEEVDGLHRRRAGADARPRAEGRPRRQPAVAPVLRLLHPVSASAEPPPSPAWRIWVSAARPEDAAGGRRARHRRLGPGRPRPQVRPGGRGPLPRSSPSSCRSGTNFANDYYDFVKGADTATRVGPRRAVASGPRRAPRHAARDGGRVRRRVPVRALGLIHWGGPWMLAVGVASILCGIAYTGGPWPLGYHGLGDLFVFVFFGLVAVTTTYFVQAGRITASRGPRRRRQWASSPRTSSS